MKNNVVVANLQLHPGKKSSQVLKLKLSLCEPDTASFLPVSSHVCIVCHLADG